MNRLLLIFFFLTPLLIQAQFVVEGKVTDTSNISLPSASIVILQQSDSTLVNFGLSDENGEFKITLSEKGSYFIQYSFLGYQEVLQPIETDWLQKRIPLSHVKMAPSEYQLSEVSVTANRIPLRLKGDTLVYDAAAFKTRTGDDVEKLLELFPGISLDSEGNLIAQGKKVDKVLVNGKEFFGSNIETATKNLDANMVKKVEIFDKQSESAEFTGIKDGNDKRTINLQLKEEFRKGSFGKLEVALGNENTYSGKVNYNRFNKTTQSSIIGNTNNINLSSYQSVTNLNSGVSGQGITDQTSAGLNISHEFNPNVSSSFNYTLLQRKSVIENNVFSQNFTDSTTFETNQDTDDETKRLSHRLNGRFKWRINQKTESTVRANATLSDQKAQRVSSTLYEPPTSGSLTESNLNQEDDQIDLSVHLALRRRFSKKRRSWINSFQFDRMIKEEETDLLNSTFGELVNQFQTFDETSTVSRFNSTYTEPINEKWFAKGDYEYKFEQNAPTRSFFDRENDDELTFNDSLSTAFQRELSAHDVQISINRNTDKLTSGAGANIVKTKLQSSGLNRDFNFVLPFLKLNYKFTNTKSIRFSYLSRSRIPQLSQLLTITNNTNPNQNYIGNANLVPEFSHVVQFSFYNFNITNQLSYNANLSFRKTQDKIINQTFINEDLTSFTTPINTDFYESFNLSGGLSGKVQLLKIKYRINLRASQEDYDAFLNSNVSRVKAQSYSTRFVISRIKREKWDLSLGVDYSVNFSSFEINANFDQRSSNFSWFAKGELELSKSFILQANYQIQRLNAVDFFGGRVLHFVNASLSKTFKEGRWEAFLVINDLLNQNIGIQRSSTINSLSESTFNTRQQFFMVGLSKKIGGNQSKKNF